MLRNLQKYFKTGRWTNNTLLGRWNNNKSLDEQLINNLYANHDHCGDIICKNPKIVQDIIKTEITNKKMYLNK